MGWVPANAMKTWSFREVRRKSAKNGDKMRLMPETVTTSQGPYEIYTAARGAHWVAWIARSADAPPERSVVIVAQTQAEAIDKARSWATRL
jgi:hypothetical protein